MNALSSIEFRWAVPDATSTERPVLQYRESRCDQFHYHPAGEWKEVPTVPVPSWEWGDIKERQREQQK